MEETRSFCEGHGRTLELDELMIRDNVPMCMSHNKLLTFVPIENLQRVVPIESIDSKNGGINMPAAKGSNKDRETLAGKVITFLKNDLKLSAEEGKKVVNRVYRMLRDEVTKG